MSNFQRVGSISNAHVGREFEDHVRGFFLRGGLILTKNFKVPVGFGNVQKPRAFDLGGSDPPTLIECKSHKWTAGDNVPSAKMTVWNESMYYFSLAPAKYRKCLVVLNSARKRSGEGLAKYYIRNYGHLIPIGVEIWEADLDSSDFAQLR